MHVEILRFFWQFSTACAPIFLLLIENVMLHLNSVHPFSCKDTAISSADCWCQVTERPYTKLPSVLWLVRAESDLCLQLFSSGLSQLGEDNCSGLWGFVEADILKEVRRAHRLVMYLRCELSVVLNVQTLTVK